MQKTFPEHKKLKINFNCQYYIFQIKTNFFLVVLPSKAYYTLCVLVELPERADFLQQPLSHFFDYRTTYVCMSMKSGSLGADIYFILQRPK